LNPGGFLARIDNGHFEVQGKSPKGKEEWVKFDIAQQTALSNQQLSNASPPPPSGDHQTQATAIDEPAPSIEAPSAGSASTNSGFPPSLEIPDFRNVENPSF
jgi:hypothetical protein